MTASPRAPSLTYQVWSRPRPSPCNVRPGDPPRARQFAGRRQWTGRTRSKLDERVIRRGVNRARRTITAKPNHDPRSCSGIGDRRPMNGACVSATSPHLDAQAEFCDDRIYLIRACSPAARCAGRPPLLVISGSGSRSGRGLGLRRGGGRQGQRVGVARVWIKTLGERPWEPTSGEENADAATSDCPRTGAGHAGRIPRPALHLIVPVVESTPARRSGRSRSPLRGGLGWAGARRGRRLASLVGGSAAG